MQINQSSKHRWKAYRSEISASRSKRIFLSRLGGVFSVSILLLLAWSAQTAISIESSEGTSESWTLFRGDPLCKGVASSILSDNPRLLWEFKEPSTAFEATPIIVDDRVYIGDLDGGFYAIDLRSGKEVWRKKFEDGFSSSPSYRDGLIYIGDYEGLVQALDAKDGSIVWTFSAEAQIDGGANFYGENVLVTSEDGNLYALHHKTGQLIWKYSTGDQLRCGPAVAGSLTYLGGCDAKLHVVDLQTGNSAGESVPLQGPTGSTPAVDGNFVFVPTHSGTVFSIDHTTNQKIWTFTDENRSQEIRSSPAIFDGKVFVTTRNKRLLALDQKTGNLLWEYIFKKRSDASPIVADGRVWVGTADGRVVAVSVKNGEEVWQSQQNGSFNGAAAAAYNRLIIANDKGSIFCFGE